MALAWHDGVTAAAEGSIGSAGWEQLREGVGAGQALRMAYAERRKGQREGGRKKMVH